MIALLTAFSSACVAWALQPEAQDSAQPANIEESRRESSILVQPPANADSPATSITPNPSAVNQIEVLPPPQRPGRQPLARQSNRVARRQPFLRPTEPGPAEQLAPPANEPSVVEEAMPAPETTEAIVRPTPHITTDTDRGARRMYRESGEVELVMVVKNPADGCLYEIPLCVPACCTGEPVMNEWRGLFGRGVVEYCWDCGFRATVKFRHILGDVKVEYDG
jgi:hypothetical protein